MPATLAAFLVVCSSCGGGGSTSPDNPVLLVSPGLLDFGSNGAVLVLRLTNEMGAPLTWAATTEGTWFRLSRSGGEVPAESTIEVEVSVDRAGLAPGVHNGRVVVSSPAQSRDVFVRVEKIPSMEIDLLATDGFIDAGGAYQEVKSDFRIEDSGDDFAYEVKIFNYGVGLPSGSQVLARPATETGGTELQSIRLGFPTQGLAAIASPSLLEWSLGPLQVGASARIIYHARAVRDGRAAHRVQWTGGGISGAVSRDVPTVIGETSPRVEFDLSDGLVDAGGVFQSSGNFQLGDGGAGKPQGLVYQIVLTNPSAVSSISNAVATVRVGGRTGIVEFRGVPPGFPTSGAVVPMGSSLIWTVNTLAPGQSAILQLLSEAVDAGQDVATATLTFDLAGGTLLVEEFTGVGN